MNPMGKVAWFPKYVLGPALAAALGFWLIGPRLAGDPKVQKLIKEKATEIASKSAEAQAVPSSESAPEESAPEGKAPVGPAPQVTVGVKPVTEEIKPAATKSRSRPKRRRRRRRSTKPAESATTTPPAPAAATTP